MLAWLVSIIGFTGGFALLDEQPFAHATLAAYGLFTMAAIACPAVWAHWTTSAILSGKERAMACLALTFALPLLIIG
jgi:hypothetical protein